MDIKTNKKAIGWLTTAHLVDDMYSGFLNPIMPFLAAKIGFTMGIATIIMAIAQVCASMFQPIFGFFADNIVKRVFIFWGLILISIFIPLAPITNNVIILTIFVILGNIGNSFFHPQALGFIAKYSKMNFIQNMGLFMSAGTIGFSIGPIVSGFVVQNFGFAKVPYTGLLGIIIAFSMFKYIPKVSGSNIKIEHKKFKESFKNILSNKFMLILMTISMMKSLILNTCAILLPFLWKNMGYKPYHIGFILFAFLFLGGIGSYLSAKAEKLFGTKTIFYISMILTCPMIILFLLTYKSYPIISTSIFVLVGFVTMLAQPAMMVMAQRILPDYRSIVSGFINGFSWGVVAIFLIIVGFCAQNFGIGKVLFIVSFIPVIFSYLIKFLPEHIEITKR